MPEPETLTSGSPLPNCGYCLGERCPCTCLEDCGARAVDFGHVCIRAPADVVAAWLRSTGMYGEDEITRITGQVP